MRFTQSCCGPRPQQSAPPVAWSLLAKFISVRNGGDLLGSWWEPGQSALALSVKYQRGSSFSDSEMLLPLICSFGGKGCR